MYVGRVNTNNIIIGDFSDQTMTAAAASIDPTRRVIINTRARATSRRPTPLRATLPSRTGARRIPTKHVRLISACARTSPFFYFSFIFFPVDDVYTTSVIHHSATTQCNDFLDKFPEIRKSQCERTRRNPLRRTHDTEVTRLSKFRRQILRFNNKFTLGKNYGSRL